MGKPVVATWDADSFRWYDGTSGEGAGPLAATNVEPTTVQPGDQVRLRYLAQETAGSNQSETPAFRLVYYYDAAGGTNWTGPNSLTSSATHFDGVSGAGVTDGGSTTQQIGGGSFNDGVFHYVDTAGSTTASLTATGGNDEYECEWVIAFHATNAEGVNFRFELQVDDGAGFAALDTITNEPTLLVETLTTNVDAGPEVLTVDEKQASVSHDRNVTAGPETLVVNELQATVSLTSDTDIDAGPETLSLDEKQAGIAFDRNIDAGPETLVVDELPATISLAVDVDSGPEILTVSTQVASVSVGFGLDAGPETLTLSEYAADVSFDQEVTAGPETLTVVEYQATITTQSDVVVDAGPETIVLTEPQASIAFDRDISAGPETLAIATSPATFSFDTGIAASVSVITVDEKQSSVTLDRNVTAGPETLSLTTHQATISAAVGTAVDAGLEALVFDEKQAEIAFDRGIDAGPEALQIGTYQAAITLEVRSVSVSLVDRYGSLQRDLTALSWAWFDAIDPVNFVSPTDQGQIESTDGDGLLEIEIPNTTLAAGQEGTLVLRADDGSAYGVYNIEVT